MSNFSVGERVVFVNPELIINPFCTRIPHMKIIILKEHHPIYESWQVYGYEFSSENGGRNFYSEEDHIRKLSEVSGELSEEIMEKVLTSIPELV